MRLSAAFTLIILFLPNLAMPQTTSPATQPSSSAPFKLIQRVQATNQDDLSCEYHFSDNYARIVDEEHGTVAFYNIANRTCYIERLDQMVAEETIDTWTIGFRERADKAIQNDTPERRKFFHSLLWPKFDIKNENGKLLIQNTAMHFEITPVENADVDIALAFAAFYKLDAYRRAYESESAAATFMPLAIADIMRDQRILPKEIKITTFTPKGSATMACQFQQDVLTQNEIELVRAIASKLDQRPNAATTQPIK